LLYVEELIGPDTVNTIPPQTLKALLQGAKIERKIDTELKQAKSLIQQLDALGLQLDKLCKELLLQGVKLFQDSYEELIQGIELKLKGAAAQK
jgi:transaldolase